MDLLIKILLTLLINISTAFPKVDPPNYNFSLNKFDLFLPGKTFEEIKKKYPNSTLLKKKGQYKIYRYEISHIRYKFPIIVQFRNDVVSDFHARLPTYFLHDLFHQALINRYGSQDIYKNTKEQSLYIWKNKQNNRHYYSGACTITCFPIFYAVKRMSQQQAGDYKSILEQLRDNELEN